MRHWFKILILTLLLPGYTGVYGQNMSLDLIIEGDSLKVMENNKIPGFHTRYEIKKYVKDLLVKYFREGYLGATIDSLHPVDSLHYQAVLRTGDPFLWSRLLPGNVNEEWWRKLGYHEKMMKGKPFDLRELQEIMKELTGFAADRGYPFAMVWLDSLIREGKGLAFQVRMKKGKRYVFGDLEIIGNAIVSKKFLREYLDFHKGEDFKMGAVEEAGKKIDELGFLQTNKSPEVEFQDGKANIRLFIDRLPSSMINGILGVAPNSGEAGKLLLTGEFQLQLRNPLGKAMKLDLKWQKMRLNTQELNILYQYPYFLSFPLGVDLQFGLLKEDTFYLKINGEAGLRYLVSGQNAFRVFYQNKRSRLLSRDSYRDLGRGREIANFNVNYYGLGVHWESLDYRLNPTKGYRADISGSVGSKTLLEGKESREQLNNSIPVNPTVYKVEMKGQYFWPVGGRSTLLTGIKGKHLIDERAFENQLFRYGGFQDLRGFDDERLLANTFMVATMEYRYLTGKNDYLKVFFDWSYFEKKMKRFRETGRPFGFGLGYNFAVRNGTFSISYALGKHTGNPIEFSNGKIHFGFVNRF